MKKTIQLLIALSSIAFAHALAAQSTSLEVTGDDTMRFNVTEIEVSAGQEITLTFKNIGKLPKQAMGHNLVVLKPGSDVAAFGNGAITAAGNEYIPTDEKLASQIVAYTKLLGPGEEDTITFTLPEAGTYPFLCSFPGHWAIMRGTIAAK